VKGEARHLEEEKDKHILEVTFGIKKKPVFGESQSSWKEVTFDKKKSVFYLHFIQEK